MSNMLGNNESLRALLQGPIADLLVKLNGENGPEVLTELNKFNRREPCWTNSKVTKKNPYLRLISGDETLTISARDGSRTIAKAKSTFPSYIDSDFTNWGLDKPGKPTVETPVDVHEMVKDANFTQMFKSISPDLDSLCHTQDQIVAFCEEHPDWLRTGGRATFFLFKENGKFFVAYVDVHSDGLFVGVHRLGDDDVWDADDRHRLVSPQLAA